ncbi:ATP-binding protein [Corynebacterium nuruki]|jgi:ATP-dependent DNA helicase RecG|uniref:ATP-dependent DNA helicase n=1 Tax=Corynebacterium nuruki TaxID=1032851 RepID=A0A3D4T0Q1_9CORY|nr:ATP-binding protein [Corynebacterium nuruki]HCT15108.1 ATP-dependent DNA helicase [Corynebacterium nuruki]
MDQVGPPEPVRRALPTVVADALERIWDGATADDLESAVLDFKEDPAHTPTKNPDAKTTQTLVSAATCFANGSAGRGFIVFGIADRTPGPAAFNGTGLAPTDVEHRIFAHTRPHLSVDAWVETVHGARLIVIHVPAGLAVHTGIDGVVRHRVGDSCLPLAGPELDALTRLRANPDQTARASDIPVTQYDEEALSTAADALQAETPDLTALLTALNVLTGDGSPTVAAEILFHRRPAGRPLARHVARPASDGTGGEVRTTEFHAPLAVTTGLLRDLVRDGVGNSVPVDAQDEALTNALLHRDWTGPDPVVVYQSHALTRVSSPGGLAPGARADRLLSGPSQPRNPCLMSAMQALGLVEWSSRGFDRMWLAMLAAGFEPPVVDARPDSVDVTLFDGEADLGFTRALSAVRTEFGRGITRDAATLATLRYLLSHADLDLDGAARLQQSTEEDARTLMTWLTQRGLLHRTAKRRNRWRLSDRTLAVMEAA